MSTIQQTREPAGTKVQAQSDKGHDTKVHIFNNQKIHLQEEIHAKKVNKIYVYKVPATSHIFPTTYKKLSVISNS